MVQTADGELQKLQPQLSKLATTPRQDYYAAAKTQGDCEKGHGHNHSYEPYENN